MQKTDAIELLTERRSVPARLLGTPAPNEAQLDIILRAAVRAPDHGRLRPWRFLVIAGEDRAKLGDVFAAALKRRRPEAEEDELEIVRGKAVRAPLVLAVIARVHPDRPKVPVREQVLSAGAAAQNILLACEALGFGAMLVTGSNAGDPHVRSELGLDEADEIIGFIHIGTPREAAPEVPHPDPADYVERWPG
jgi:nitroreductase